MKKSGLHVLSMILLGLMLTSAIAIFTVHAPQSNWVGYVKPSFPDYVPSGMPDFDEKQDQWGPGQGVYTWCVPVAVANSLWWLDSKYESLLFPAAVPPPTISDHFNLVTSYGQWDDHSPNNVDPLVRNLAFLMDTDGQRTGIIHTGTLFTDVQAGIQMYLLQQGVAEIFEVHNSTYPTFAWIDNETLLCQDVELFLDFWQWNGLYWTKGTITEPSLENGHCVTVAGSNTATNEVLISDPWQDAFEAGLVPTGRSPVAHPYPHPSSVHNDAQYVSQDAYTVVQDNFIQPPPPPPPGYPMQVCELAGYLQTMGFDPSFHAFIMGAIATSPLGIHDVAVTNVTTSKTGCTPMPTVGQGLTAKINVTVENHGTFNEIDINITAFALPMLPPPIVIGSTNVSLTAGSSTIVTIVWNTTGASYGNYTISATATPVPGETNTADNTFTDGTLLLTIPGDINGDFRVNLQDLVLLANAYGSKPGDMKWNPNADLNGNGTVDLPDLVIMANHYNQHYP
jgi:hypothetical protein